MNCCSTSSICYCTRNYGGCCTCGTRYNVGYLVTGSAGGGQGFALSDFYLSDEELLKLHSEININLSDPDFLWKYLVSFTEEDGFIRVVKLSKNIEIKRGTSNITMVKFNYDRFLYLTTPPKSFEVEVEPSLVEAAAETLTRHLDPKHVTLGNTNKKG